MKLAFFRGGRKAWCSAGPIKIFPCIAQESAGILMLSSCCLKSGTCI